MLETSTGPRANSTPEEWRTASDHHYEVSNLGRIRRAKPGHANTYVGKIIKPTPDKNGYLRVVLSHSGTSVAREVARAFLGPRPEGLQINHRNGVKTDNRPENLEYVTCKENIHHAMRNGLKAIAKAKVRRHDA